MLSVANVRETWKFTAPLRRLTKETPEQTRDLLKQSFDITLTF
jgi:hypothetical protein